VRGHSEAALDALRAARQDELFRWLQHGRAPGG
jgi:hypothetical protein